MDIMERMNRAVRYIEQHITEDINLGVLAQLTAFSTYNFQRAFSCIADMTVVEYIKRRRLTLAALELQEKETKVIDVAVKYGYDSPVSFGRAFKAVHGITPSEAKKLNKPLLAFPRISFQIAVKGVQEMNYRIVKTDSFQVFGLEGLISTIGEAGYYRHEGAIWQDNHQNEKYETLFQDIGDEPNREHDSMFVTDMCRIHGLMNYKKINETTYGYLQCGFVVPGSRTEGYTIFEVPATTWAVFPSELVDWNAGAALMEINRRFYSEWLPASEYEKADTPEFEMYGGTAKKGYVELWMPIVKK